MERDSYVTSESPAQYSVVDYLKNVRGVFNKFMDPQKLSGGPRMLPKRSFSTTEKFLFSWPSNRPRKKPHRKKLTSPLLEETNSPSTTEGQEYKKKNMVTTTSGDVRSTTYLKKTTLEEVESSTTVDEYTGISWKKFNWNSEHTSSHTQKEKHTTQHGPRKTSSTRKPKSQMDVDQESSDYELTHSEMEYQSEEVASKEYADYYSSETDTGNIEPNQDLNDNPTTTEPSELDYTSQGDMMNIEPTNQQNEEPASSESLDNTFSNSEVLNGEEDVSENPYSISEAFLTLRNNEQPSETSQAMSGEDINQDIVTASDEYIEHPVEQKPKSELTGLDSQQKKKLFELADELLKDFNTSTATGEKSTVNFDHETPKIVEQTAKAEYEKVSPLSAENDYENSQNPDEGSSMQPQETEEISDEGMGRSSEKSEVTELETTEILKKVINQYMTEVIPETVSDVWQFNWGEGSNATEENGIAAPSELTIAAAVETEEEEQTEMLKATTELEEVSFTSRDLMATENENEESPSVTEESEDIGFGRLDKNTVIYDENEEEMSSPKVGDEFDISGELETEVPESELTVKNTENNTASTKSPSSPKSLAEGENNTSEMNETLESEDLASKTEKMEKHTKEPNVSTTSEAGSTADENEVESATLGKTTNAMLGVTDYDENDDEFAKTTALPEYQKYEPEMGTSEGIINGSSTKKHVKSSTTVEEISEETKISVKKSTNIKETHEEATEESTSYTHRKLGSTELMTLGNIITLVSESSTSSETGETETSESFTQSSSRTTEYQKSSEKINEKSSFTGLQQQKTKPMPSEKTTELSETSTHSEIEITSEASVPAEPSTHETPERTEKERFSTGVEMTSEEISSVSQTSKEGETEQFSLTGSESSTSTISLASTETTGEVSTVTHRKESPIHSTISSSVPTITEGEVSKEVQSSITIFGIKGTEPTEEFSESSTSISISTKAAATSTYIPSNERFSSTMSSEETAFSTKVESKEPIEVSGSGTTVHEVENEVEESTSQMSMKLIEATIEVANVSSEETAFSSTVESKEPILVTESGTTVHGVENEVEESTSQMSMKLTEATIEVTNVSSEETAFSSTVESKEPILVTESGTTVHEVEKEVEESTLQMSMKHIETTIEVTTMSVKELSSFSEATETLSSESTLSSEIVATSTEVSEETTSNIEVPMEVTTNETLFYVSPVTLVGSEFTVESVEETGSETPSTWTHTAASLTDTSEVSGTLISEELETKLEITHVLPHEMLSAFMTTETESISTIQETSSWITSNISPEEISGTSEEIPSNQQVVHVSTVTLEEVESTAQLITITEGGTPSTETSTLATTESELISSTVVLNNENNETTETIILEEASSMIPSTISMEPSGEFTSNTPVITQMTTVVTATASERDILSHEVSSSIISEETKSTEESAVITENKKTPIETSTHEAISLTSTSSVMVSEELESTVEVTHNFSEISSSFMSAEMESMSSSEATEEFMKVTESETTKQKASSLIPFTISTELSEEVSSSAPIVVKMPTVVKATATGRYIPPHEISSVRSAVTSEEAVFTEESTKALNGKTEPTETFTLEESSSTSRTLGPEELETTVGITHVVLPETTSIFSSSETELISSTEAEKESTKSAGSEEIKNNTLQEASSLMSSATSELYGEITSNTPIIIPMSTYIEATVSEKYIPQYETSSSVIQEEAELAEESVKASKSSSIEASTHEAKSLTSTSEVSSTVVLETIEETHVLPTEISSIFLSTEKELVPSTGAEEESVKVAEDENVENTTVYETSSWVPSISLTELSEEISSSTPVVVEMPTVVRANTSEIYFPPHEVSSFYASSEESKEFTKESVTYSRTSETETSTLTPEEIETTMEETHVSPYETSSIPISTEIKLMSSTEAKGEVIEVGTTQNKTTYEETSWISHAISTEPSEETSLNTPRVFQMPTVVKISASEIYIPPHEISSFHVITTLEHAESTQQSIEAVNEAILTQTTELSSITSSETESISSISTKVEKVIEGETTKNPTFQIPSTITEISKGIEMSTQVFLEHSEMLEVSTETSEETFMKDTKTAVPHNIYTPTESEIKEMQEKSSINEPSFSMFPSLSAEEVSSTSLSIAGVKVDISAEKSTTSEIKYVPTIGMFSFPVGALTKSEEIWSQVSGQSSTELSMTESQTSTTETTSETEVTFKEPTEITANEHTENLSHGTSSLTTTTVLEKLEETASQAYLSSKNGYHNPSEEETFSKVTYEPHEVSSVVSSESEAEATPLFQFTVHDKTDLLSTEVTHVPTIGMLSFPVGALTKSEEIWSQVSGQSSTELSTTESQTTEPTSETEVTFKEPTEITANEHTENLSHGTSSLTTTTVLEKLEETASQAYLSSKNGYHKTSEEETFSKVTYEPHEVSSVVPSESEAEATPLFQFTVHDKTDLLSTEVTHVPTIGMLSFPVGALTKSEEIWSQVSGQSSTELSMTESQTSTTETTSETEVTFKESTEITANEHTENLSHGTSSLTTTTVLEKLEETASQAYLSSENGYHKTSEEETFSKVTYEPHEVSSVVSSESEAEATPLFQFTVHDKTDLLSTEVTHVPTIGMLSFPVGALTKSEEIWSQVSGQSSTELSMTESQTSTTETTSETEETFKEPTEITANEHTENLSHGTSSLTTTTVLEKLEETASQAYLSSENGYHKPSEEETFSKVTYEPHEVSSVVPSESEAEETPLFQFTVQEKTDLLSTGMEASATPSISVESFPNTEISSTSTGEISSLEEYKNTEVTLGQEVESLTISTILPESSSGSGSSTQMGTQWPGEVETIFTANKAWTGSESLSSSTAEIEEVKTSTNFTSHDTSAPVSSIETSEIETTLLFQPNKYEDTEVISQTGSQSTSPLVKVETNSVMTHISPFETSSLLSSTITLEITQEYSPFQSKETETEVTSPHEPLILTSGLTEVSVGSESQSALTDEMGDLVSEGTTATIETNNVTIEMNIHPPVEVGATSETLPVSTEVTQAIGKQMPKEFKETPGIPYIPIHERPSSVTSEVTGEAGWSPITGSLLNSEVSQSEIFAQRIPTEMSEVTDIRVVSTTESKLQTLTEQEQNISVRTQVPSLAMSEKEGLFANVSTGKSETKVEPKTEVISTELTVVSTEPTDALEFTEMTMNAINESSSRVEETNPSTESTTESTIITEITSLMPTEVEISTELTYTPSHGVSKYTSIFTDKEKSTGPFETTIFSTSKEISGESEATLNGTSTSETVQTLKEIGKTSAESEATEHEEYKQPTAISEHEIATNENRMFQFHFPSSEIVRLSTSEAAGVDRTSEATAASAIIREKASSFGPTALQDKENNQSVTGEPSEEALEEFAFTKVLEESTLCETCSEETTTEQLKPKYTTTGTTELEEAAETISQDEDVEQKLIRYSTIHLKITTKSESKSKTKETEILEQTTKYIPLKPTEPTSQALTVEKSAETRLKTETITQVSESLEYTKESEKLPEKGTEVEGTSEISNEKSEVQTPAETIEVAETSRTVITELIEKTGIPEQKIGSSIEPSTGEVSSSGIPEVTTELLSSPEYPETQGSGATSEENTVTTETEVESTVESEENIKGTSVPTREKTHQTQATSERIELSETPQSPEAEGAVSQSIPSSEGIEETSEFGSSEKNAKEVTEASESTVGEGTRTEIISTISEEISELDHSIEESAETPELESGSIVEHEGDVTEASKATIGKSEGSEASSYSEEDTETLELEVESTVKHEEVTEASESTIANSEETETTSYLEKSERTSELGHSLEESIETSEQEVEGTENTEVSGTTSHSEETSELSHSSEKSTETAEIKEENEGKVTEASASGKPQEISEQSSSIEEGTTASDLEEESTIKHGKNVTEVPNTVIDERTEIESTLSSEESEETSVEAGAETTEPKVKSTVKQVSESILEKSAGTESTSHSEETAEMGHYFKGSSETSELEMESTSRHEGEATEASELAIAESTETAEPEEHGEKITEASASEKPQEISEQSSPIDEGTTASDLEEKSTIKHGKNVTEVPKTVIEESTEIESTLSSEESEETSVEAGAETTEPKVKSTVKQVSESILEKSAGTESTSHSEETAEMGHYFKGSSETSELEMESTSRHEGEATEASELAIAESTETAEPEEHGEKITEASASEKPQEISEQSSPIDEGTTASDLEEKSTIKHGKNVTEVPNTVIDESTEIESTLSSEESEETSVEAGAETTEPKVKSTVKQVSESILEKSAGTESTSHSEETAEMGHYFKGSSETSELEMESTSRHEGEATEASELAIAESTETAEPEEHGEKITEASASEKPQEISEQSSPIDEGTTASDLEEESTIKHGKNVTEVPKTVIEESTEIQSTLSSEESAETSVEAGAETTELKVESSVKQVSESILEKSAGTATTSHSEETAEMGHYFKGSYETSELEMESTSRLEGEVSEASELAIAESTETSETGEHGEKITEASASEKPQEEETSEMGYSSGRNAETSEQEMKTTVKHEGEVTEAPEITTKESTEISEIEVGQNEKVTATSASERPQEISELSSSIEEEGPRPSGLEKETTTQHEKNVTNISETVIKESTDIEFTPSPEESEKTSVEARTETIELEVESTVKYKENSETSEIDVESTIEHLEEVSKETELSIEESSETSEAKVEYFTLETEVTEVSAREKQHEDTEAYEPAAKTTIEHEEGATGASETLVEENTEIESTSSSKIQQEMSVKEGKNTEATELSIEENTETSEIEVNSPVTSEIGLTELSSEKLPEGTRASELQMKTTIEHEEEATEASETVIEENAGIESTSSSEISQETSVEEGAETPEPKKIYTSEHEGISEISESHSEKTSELHHSPGEISGISQMEPTIKHEGGNTEASELTTEESTETSEIEEKSSVTSEAGVTEVSAPEKPQEGTRVSELEVETTIEHEEEVSQVEENTEIEGAKTSELEIYTTVKHEEVGSEATESGTGGSVKTMKYEEGRSTETSEIELESTVKNEGEAIEVTKISGINISRSAETEVVMVSEKFEVTKTPITTVSGSLLKSTSTSALTLKTIEQEHTKEVPNMTLSGQAITESNISSGKNIETTTVETKFTESVEEEDESQLFHFSRPEISGTLCEECSGSEISTEGVERGSTHHFTHGLSELLIEGVKTAVTSYSQKLEEISELNAETTVQHEEVTEASESEETAESHLSIGGVKTSESEKESTVEHEEVTTSSVIESVKTSESKVGSTIAQKVEVTKVSEYSTKESATEITSYSQISEETSESGHFVEGTETSELKLGTSVEQEVTEVTETSIEEGSGSNETPHSEIRGETYVSGYSVEEGSETHELTIEFTTEEEESESLFEGHIGAETTSHSEKPEEISQSGHSVEGVLATSQLEVESTVGSESTKVLALPTEKGAKTSELEEESATGKNEVMEEGEETDKTASSIEEGAESSEIEKEFTAENEVTEESESHFNTESEATHHSGKFEETSETGQSVEEESETSIIETESTSEISELENETVEEHKGETTKVAESSGTSEETPVSGHSVEEGTEVNTEYTTEEGESGSVFAEDTEPEATSEETGETSESSNSTEGAFATSELKVGSTVGSKQVTKASVSTTEEGAETEMTKNTYESGPYIEEGFGTSEKEMESTSEYKTISLESESPFNESAESEASPRSENIEEASESGHSVEEEYKTSGMEAEPSVGHEEVTKAMESSVKEGAETSEPENETVVEHKGEVTKVSESSIEIVAETEVTSYSQTSAESSESGHSVEGTKTSESREETSVEEEATEISEPSAEEGPEIKETPHSEIPTETYASGHYVEEGTETSELKIESTVKSAKEIEENETEAALPFSEKSESSHHFVEEGAESSEPTVEYTLKHEGESTVSSKSSVGGYETELISETGQPVGGTRTSEVEVKSTIRHEAEVTKTSTSATKEGSEPQESSHPEKSENTSESSTAENTETAESVETKTHLAEKSEGRQFVSSIIGAENITEEYTEEENTAERRGSTVEIQSETTFELEETGKGRVSSHTPLRTSKTTEEVGIEKEEHEKATSVSSISSVENVTTEGGNAISLHTSVGEEIIQGTTLKSITLSSKPAHSVTPGEEQEKTEQSGITSALTVKFDIKNVSHPATYMSSIITGSTEEVAEEQLFHFSKTPEGSTLCQECSNVTEKSTVSHEGSTTHEVSSKHPTNEKEEGSTSKIASSVESTIKVTAQTKSTESETEEIVETTEESLEHTKPTEALSPSSILKEETITHVNINKLSEGTTSALTSLEEEIEGSTITIGERTHSTRVHAKESHSTQLNLESTEKFSTHVSEEPKHTTKAHPAVHHKTGITAKTKPEDFLQTLTELSAPHITSTAEEYSPTESSEDVEVLTELGVQNENFVLKTAIENITEESHPTPSFKTVIHGASTHRAHTGSGPTKTVVVIVNNSGKKIEKINETALQKLLNRSISEVNLEYIDLYNISKEPEGSANKSEGPQIVQPSALKGDGKVCHRSEFESNHACVCDVDTYLKSIEHKLGDNLKVDIKHYNCSHLVSFHDGLVISNATKPVERRKRSLMYLSNKDRSSNVIENNDIEEVFSADYELQTSDSNILALPGTKALLYCHNKADALLGNEGVAYSWEFNGDASKSGEILPTNENPLIIHNVEIKNEGNYTCSKTEEDGKKERYDHELEVVTLPIYKIKTTIFYSVNDTCSLSDGDLLYSYLPKIMGPILCGGSGKLCTVDVARPRCFTKNDDNYFNVTVTATMNDVGSIFPGLAESKCSSTNCKLKAYTNMVGLVNKNAEIVKKLPVFSKINPHLEFLTNVSFSGGKAESSKPPRIITTCTGGYGIEKFKQRICVVCPKHTYSGDDEAFCKICPAGQYQPQAGSKACLPCSSPVDDSMCLRMLYTDTKLFKIYVGVAFGLVLLMIFIIIFWNSSTKRYPKRQFEGSLKHHRAMRRRNFADIEKQDLEPLLKKDNENRRNSPPEVPPPDF